VLASLGLVSAQASTAADKPAACGCVECKCPKCDGKKCSCADKCECGKCGCTTAEKVEAAVKSCCAK